MKLQVQKDFTDSILFNKAKGENWQLMQGECSDNILA